MKTSVVYNVCMEYPEYCPIYIHIYICYTDVTLMCIPYLYIFAKALMEEGHVKVKTQSFSFSPMDVW